MKEYDGKCREKYHEEYFKYLWERMQKERKQDEELTERTIQVVLTDTFYLEKHSERDFISWFDTEETLKEAEETLKKCLALANRKNLIHDLKAYCKDMQYFNDFLKTQYYPITKKEIEECDSVENIIGKEKYILTKTRINQGAIRKNALKKYNSCCAVCNMNIEDLLIASHIKSWAVSMDDEKGDSDNVLLLCPSHDALFDKHYISFDDTGKLIISKKIDEVNQKLMNINVDMYIKLTDKMKKYMEEHRKSLK